MKFSKNNDTIKIEIRFIIDLNQIDDKLQKKLHSKLKDYPFGVIQISVRDQEIGIKKENINKIFQLFGFLDAS